MTDCTMEVKDMRSAERLSALSYDALSEADRQHALTLLGTFYRAYNKLATRLAFVNGRIEQLKEQTREAEEDKRDAAAEAPWSERQGDDYGSF